MEDDSNSFITKHLIHSYYGRGSEKTPVKVHQYINRFTRHASNMYEANHHWVKSHKLRHDPFTCESCGELKRLDLANIHPNRLCTREPKDYKWLCHKCHMSIDAEWRYQLLISKK
jgi:hypothetical protein